MKITFTDEKTDKKGKRRAKLSKDGVVVREKVVTERQADCLLYLWGDESPLRFQTDVEGDDTLTAENVTREAVAKEIDFFLECPRGPGMKEARYRASWLVYLLV